MSRYWQCSECYKLTDYKLSSHTCSVCGKEKGSKNKKGPGVVFNLMKAQREGPISTYREGDHSDFYVNELLMSAAQDYT